MSGRPEAALIPSQTSEPNQGVLAAQAPVWLAIHGNSMSPTWIDGSRLLVVPASLESLHVGDCVAWRQDNQLIAHRFIRRKKISNQWYFQTKADNASAAEAWQSAGALIGRVAAIESSGRLLPLDRGWVCVRQRLIGLSALWFWRLSENLTRNRKPAIEDALISCDSPQQRRLLWAKQALLKSQVGQCLDWLKEIECPALVLKGQALIAQGWADPEIRDVCDVDILVPQHQAKLAIQALLKHGMRIDAPQGAARAALDDQVTLTHPQGGRFDLHWSLVNGGWRFRDVIRVDEAGLWRRSQTVNHDGLVLKVLSAEDQWLHLCMHLILSGATGIKWWSDLKTLLQQEALIDWQTVAQQAGQWRVRTITWLALDTLWQRWRIQVPLEGVRSLRPSWVRRFWLRTLLPKDLTQADIQESRFKRHLRELLLMDRFRDSLQLLWRWSRPPEAWRAFHHNGNALY